jgi:hypothetical protein
MGRRKRRVSEEQRRRAEDKMWHTANVAFSAADRAAFMAYRHRLWILADQLLDEAHGLAFQDEPRYEELCRLAEAVMDTIQDIPVLAP